MNIVGIGVDIIENHRIEKVLSQWPKQFREKVFLPDEIQYCDTHQNAFRHYAARFACKEAVFKAFGVGWSRHIGWLDIEIMREISGKPCIQFHGKGKALAESLGIQQTMVAFSHSDEYSVAQVILLT